MRALIDVDEKQIEALDSLAKQRKRSRASLIREAVTDYLRNQSDDRTEGAFGLWGKKKIDGVAYQEKIRSEW